MTAAVARMTAALGASETAQERRLETAFRASPDGRLFARVSDQILTESQQEVNAGVVDMLRAALATGVSAAQHFVDQADAASQPSP